MTGVQLGKAVTTDAAWARQVQQRLSALENPIQQRIGSFVLTDNNSGSLVAHSPLMTPTVLAGAHGFATLLQQATAAATGGASSSTTTVDAATGLTIGGVVSLIQGLLQNGVQLAETAGETGLQDFLNLLAGVLDLTGEIEYTASEVATGLEGFLTNLSTSGVLSLAGLALGALPTGITLAVGGLTGLATGIETWLASGGALPSGRAARSAGPCGRWVWWSSQCLSPDLGGFGDSLADEGAAARPVRQTMPADLRGCVRQRYSVSGSAAASSGVFSVTVLATSRRAKMSAPS